MRLTLASRYALHAVAYLARRGKGQRASVEEIAEAEGLPRHFVAKVLVRLVRAGLVATARGSTGGTWLTRPAQAITLRDVIEAVEGPLRGEAPLAHAPGSTRLDRYLDTICKQAGVMVGRQLAAVSIADLIRAPGRRH